MVKKNKIIFITSYNRKIGYGHYSRILSIFENIKTISYILLNTKKKIQNKRILNFNITKPQKKYLKLIKNNVVVVDLPKINIGLIKFLKESNSKKLVYFNDSQKKNKIFDINISILYSKNNRYSGKKFITLNKKLYKNNRKFEIDYLVSLGMSKNNYNPKLANLLNNLQKKSIYITNKNIKNLKYVKFIKPCSKKKFYNILNISNAIISAAGQTCLEALYLKKNILIFRTSPNQNNNIKFLNKNNFKTYKNINKFLKNKKKASRILKRLIQNSQKKIFIKNGVSTISNILKKL